MSSEPVRVAVQIMNSEYRIACPKDKQEALLEAAGFLNERMQTIRDSGKVLSLERIAVMAALNLSHELLAYQRDTNELKNAVDQRTRRLLKKVESILEQMPQRTPAEIEP